MKKTLANYFSWR